MKTKRTRLKELREELRRAKLMVRLDLHALQFSRRIAKRIGAAMRRVQAEK